MQGAVVNATVVTMDPQRRVLENAGILWHDGKIQMIAASQDVREKARNLGIRIKDAKGAAVFPGLVNTHNHLFQHLLKGLGTDMELETWWPGVIGPAGIQLRETHLQAAVRGGVLEALRSGTTTIADYMQVHPVPGLSAVEIETARELGVRLVYGRGYRNYAKDPRFPRQLIDNMNQVFGEVQDLKKRYQDDMTKVWLAPAGVWALTYEALENTAAFSKEQNVPVMMHVFETETDNQVCLARYQKRAIACYEDSGLLSPQFLAVHSVHTDAQDIAAFARHGVKVSHNPVSNMYLASGVSPVPEFLKAGIVVSVATDGAASNNGNNMLETLKTTALLQKVISRNPLAMTAQTVLEMATIGGARALGLENSIGSLEIGKQADLFLLDPAQSPGCCPIHDPVASLVYSSDTRGVTMTVVNGSILLEDGEFVSLDEEAMLRDEQRLAQDLYNKTEFGALIHKRTDAK